MEAFVLTVVLAAAAGAVAGALASRLFAARPASPRSVLAEEFHLVDRDGTRRAGLFLESDGSPRFMLYDGGEKPRLTLGLGSDGEPTVDLADKSGSSRLVMFLAANGNPFWALRDQEGKVRAAMGVGADGEPYVTLLDKGGAPLWSARR